VHTGPAKVLASPAWVIQESDEPIMGGAIDDRSPRRVADHLTVVLAQTRNPSQKIARAERRTYESRGVV